MWKYKEITRSEFEKRKAFVEQIFIELGAEISDLGQPHSVSSYGNQIQETIFSNRPVFAFQGQYYRVDEVLFPLKPFIVVECTDQLQHVINNAMEDADPFPYDLSDDQIVEEIHGLLGIENP